MKVKSESEVAQSRPTLSDPMDCSPPGSSNPWDFPGKSTGVGYHCLTPKEFLARLKYQSQVKRVEGGREKSQRSRAWCRREEKEKVLCHQNNTKNMNLNLVPPSC